MQPSIEEALLGQFRGNLMVNIYGKAGTGKSSMAQYLVGTVLRRQKDTNAVWIKASQEFSATRLTSFFGQASSVGDRIYLLPKYGICKDLEQQNGILRRIADGALFLPPRTRHLIIDNISHHLRRTTGDQAIGRHVYLKNKFFESTLGPLLLFCRRTRIRLILIHEATQLPAEDHREEIIRPYYYKLYAEIPALFIRLGKPFNSSNAYRIELNHSPTAPPERSFAYRIRDTGFQFTRGAP